MSDEENEIQEAKQVNPLDLLPKSTLNLVQWKKMYSNNDTDIAMKWLWENFDYSGYSIWKVDYNYNNELKMTFMSNNLIGGFYRELEKYNKYCFGNLVVRGRDNDNIITGYFIFRGQGNILAEFDNFTFTKINNSIPFEDIYSVFAWENCVSGKTFK